MSASIVACDDPIEALEAARRLLGAFTVEGEAGVATVAWVGAAIDDLRGLGAFVSAPHFHVRGNLSGNWSLHLRRVLQQALTGIDISVERGGGVFGASLSMPEGTELGTLQLSWLASSGLHRSELTSAISALRPLGISAEMVNSGLQRTSGGGSVTAQVGRSPESIIYRFPVELADSALRVLDDLVAGQGAAQKLHLSVEASLGVVEGLASLPDWQACSCCVWNLGYVNYRARRSDVAPAQLPQVASLLAAGAGRERFIRQAVFAWLHDREARRLAENAVVWEVGRGVVHVRVAGAERIPRDVIKRMISVCGS